MLHIAWSELYCHPLPAGHRFPMEKYELIPEQLLYEGSIRAEQLVEPKPLPEAWLLLTHTQGYWGKLKEQRLSQREQRRTGFPLSQRLVQRGRVIAQGTIDNALWARQHGVSINGAGGTHHAYADRGEGFCLLNDIAIAAKYLLAHRLAQQVLVIDLDVHQGNGTAAIFRDCPQVFTFSMHGAANYPLHKETSDLDIPLPTGTGDEVYLRVLADHLPPLLDQLEPDFVFYLAGVDILASDKLGKLSCSLEGCKLRDRYVMQLCHRHGIPVAVCLGGGYSPRIKDLVEAHCQTFREALNIWF